MPPFTTSSDGECKVEVIAGKFTDAAGNTNTDAAGNTNTAVTTFTWNKTTAAETPVVTINRQIGTLYGMNGATLANNINFEITSTTDGTVKIVNNNNDIEIKNESNTNNIVKNTKTTFTISNPISNGEYNQCKVVVTNSGVSGEKALDTFYVVPSVGKELFEVVCLCNFTSSVDPNTSTFQQIAEYAFTQINTSQTVNPGKYIGILFLSSSLGILNEGNITIRTGDVKVKNSVTVKKASETDFVNDPEIGQAYGGFAYCLMDSTDTPGDLTFNINSIVVSNYKDLGILNDITTIAGPGVTSSITFNSLEDSVISDNTIWVDEDVQKYEDNSNTKLVFNIDDSTWYISHSINITNFGDGGYLFINSEGADNDVKFIKYDTNNAVWTESENNIMYDNIFPHQIYLSKNGGSTDSKVADDAFEVDSDNTYKWYTDNFYKININNNVATIEFLLGPFEEETEIDGVSSRTKIAFVRGSQVNQGEVITGDISNSLTLQDNFSFTYPESH